MPVRSPSPLWGVAGCEAVGYLLDPHRTPAPRRRPSPTRGGRPRPEMQTVSSDAHAQSPDRRRQDRALHDEAAACVARREPPFYRIAYAAAHVVADPLADTDPWVDTAIDWERTIAFRRHLWGLGLGVAEAMDTAQRGMGMDWPKSLELIRRSIEAVERLSRRAGRLRRRHRSPRARRRASRSTTSSAPTRSSARRSRSSAAASC